MRSYTRPPKLGEVICYDGHPVAILIESAGSGDAPASTREDFRQNLGPKVSLLPAGALDPLPDAGGERRSPGVPAREAAE